MYTGSHTNTHSVLTIQKKLYSGYIFSVDLGRYRQSVTHRDCVAVGIGKRQDGPDERETADKVHYSE